MITFEHPEFFLLLIALPLLVITHYFLFKFTRKKAMRFANLKTLKRVSGERIMSWNLPVLALRIFAITAVVMALAAPTWWFEAQGQRTEYVIAIDASASMTATDISPSRIDAAKQQAVRFVDELNATTRIGVVSFAGTTRIEQRPTTDLVAVQKAIEGITIAPASGTDIGGALITATNLLAASSHGRAIILYTDGSTTTGTHIDDPLLEGVRAAREENTVIHAVGLGSVGEAPAGYLPSLYNITAVFSAEDLEFVTNQTGGAFVQASNAEELDAAYENLQSSSFDTLQPRPLGTAFLLVALLLLFIEWGLINTRYRFIP